MPWLVQGTTTRGAGEEPFDLGRFTGASSPDRVDRRWRHLLSATGVERAVLSRQVHEAEVRVQGASGPGLHLEDVCDGHATSQAGVLLAVTVADCVPVFVAAPEAVVVAVLHAGWRGAVAGVLERGLAVLQESLEVPPGDLLLHLGPSICGACYEVGPEVFEALDQSVPPAPLPIDLRGVLARKAARAGVPTSAISVSAHCTRCTDSGLFSHRAGDRERQVGFIGIRS
jgi:YfiH family protein